MELLESFSKETLIKLIKMYSRNWITVDGLWFSNVEEEYGLEAALKLDLKMWEAQPVIETKRLKETIGIEGEGPSAVMKAINLQTYTPCMPPVVEEEPNKVTLTFPHCLPQEARVRKGRGEFPCKPMGMACFANIAKVIDPRVKVSCLFCPPDPHPEDIWCKWELSI